MSSGWWAQGRAYEDLEFQDPRSPERSPGQKGTGQHDVEESNQLALQTSHSMWKEHHETLQHDLYHIIGFYLLIISLITL